MLNMVRWEEIRELHLGGHSKNGRSSLVTGRRCFGTWKQNGPLYQVKALYALSPQFLETGTLVASEILS